MEVKAYLRHLRMSPRKVRLVIDSVKGLMVHDALDRLPFIQKHATRPVAKLLQSAVANAEHNFKLDPERLYIKDIRADQGPSLKRWTPRAHGRAAPIVKRTTHISLILDDISQKASKGKMRISSKAAVRKVQADSQKVEPIKKVLEKKKKDK